MNKHELLNKTHIWHLLKPYHHSFLLLGLITYSCSECNIPRSKKSSHLFGQKWSRSLEITLILMWTVGKYTRCTSHTDGMGDECSKKLANLFGGSIVLYIQNISSRNNFAMRIYAVSFWGSLTNGTSIRQRTHPSFLSNGFLAPIVVLLTCAICLSIQIYVEIGPTQRGCNRSPGWHHTLLSRESAPKPLFSTIAFWVIGPTYANVNIYR